MNVALIAVTQEEIQFFGRSTFRSDLAGSQGSGLTWWYGVQFTPVALSPSIRWR